jgi:uncharacterized protein
VTIDVNVSLFRHPTRRLPYDDAVSLAAFLQSKGVIQAWAGSFEALLHRDMAGVNLRLVEECRRTAPGFLVPFGTVNPRLPDWKDDLRRCLEEHQMPGIRLYPGHHGYTLDAPEFRELLQLAGERGCLVQLVVRVEDPRTQHPLLQIPDVDPGLLKATLAGLSRSPSLVILNGLMSTSIAMAAELAQAGKVFFDIATLEGVSGIARILKSLPAERLLFGSHTPFFVWESADLKLMESELPQPLIEQIRAGNASTLIADNAR